jgi:hypothetical protein
MKDLEEVPKPIDSGSDGSQSAGSKSPELVAADPLRELPIAHTIQGIAASNSRAFGGEVASALIAGVTSQLASELQYSKNEVVKLQDKNDQLTKQISERNVENAVLNERLTASNATRHLRNFGIAAGTTLVTVSFALFDTVQFQSYGYVAVAIGVLLVMVGWFTPVRGVDK